MKWKSVKDSLPKIEDRSCIVRYDTGSIEMVHIEDWLKDKRCEFNSVITHWLEMPEFREEKNE